MGDPFVLMGRGPKPAGFALGDLTRLRLGTVSEVPTPWWCLQDDLRRIGVDPATVPATHGRTMRENAEALERGEIDLAQVFEPFASELEARGVATAWHAQASRGPTSYTAFYATRERVAARREAFKGMVRAMAETLTWLHATPPAEIAEVNPVAPAVPDAAPAAPEIPDYDTVVGPAVLALAGKNRAAAQAILRSYKAAKASDVDPTKWAELVDKMNAARLA
jgi:NitT/TauT family transport system substrate-binding protein